MSGSFRIGRIAGINVNIHFTWIFVFALLAYSLAAGVFPNEFPGWRQVEYWTTGIITALLLFVSVLVHEFAHSIVARQRGLEVEGITLFIFGGVAQLKSEAKSGGDEFAIAAVGPAASLVIAVLLWGLHEVINLPYDPVEASLAYLARVNLMLAIFNLMPGFPLDGGRILRALVWQMTGNFDRATRIATGSGQLIAIGFILFGIWIMFTGAFAFGLWAIFIGWFLHGAAQQSQVANDLQRAFRGILVQQLLETNAVTVAPQLSLRELVEFYMMSHGMRALPVVLGDQLVGLITIAEIKATPTEKWPFTRVNDVMRRGDAIGAVTPKDDLLTAVQRLADPDMNLIPVVDGGRFVGVLTRAGIVGFLSVREELSKGLRKS